MQHKRSILDNRQLPISDFDIVIVNYNSTDCLVECLRSIYNTTLGFTTNIIIQDNASIDQPASIRAKFPEVIISLNQTNIGFAKAVNKAISLSVSPYIILLNPDTLLTSGFIDPIITYLNANKNVGIVSPKILNSDGSTQGSARSFPTPLTSLFGRNSPISKLFPNNSITAKNVLTIKNGFKGPIEVDWVSGACMIVRREAIDQVGGLDERFFMYWEDADWCRRMRISGWKVVYYPETLIYHSIGESSSSSPYRSTYHFHKSSFRLFEKYAGWPLNLFQPVAIAGLVLRCMIVMLIHFVNKLYRKHIKDKPAYPETLSSKPRMYKILRIISRMNIGGPSIHVKNLTENLNTDQFTTRLITGTVSPMEGDMGYITNFKNNVITNIPELQREISPYLDLKALLKVVKAVHCYKPDIVHSHTSKAGTISRIAVFIYNLFRKEKIVAVHTFHGHVLDSYFNKFTSFLFISIEKFLAKVTDRIIAISETQKWELSNIYSIDSSHKINITKLGFNLSPFLNCSIQKGILRKNIGIGDDTLLVGIIGRLVQIKNHKLFLDVAKIILEKRSNISIKFIIVGDGELRSELEKYAEDVGVQDDTIFYGWEKKIEMIYADLDILALTSLNEGTPVSVIEAMAASVPVITTGVGGVKDLLGKIEVGFNNNSKFKLCERGILCPKDDPEAFAEGLLYMIEGNLRKDDVTDIAKKYVLNNYSLDRLVRDIENLYFELLKHRSNRLC